MLKTRALLQLAILPGYVAVCFAAGITEFSWRWFLLMAGLLWIDFSSYFCRGVEERIKAGKA